MPPSFFEVPALQKNSAARQPPKGALPAWHPCVVAEPAAIGADGSRQIGAGCRDQCPVGCALSQARNCWNSACFAASVRLALTPGLVCARNVLNRACVAAPAVPAVVCCASQSCAGWNRVQPGTC